MNEISSIDPPQEFEQKIRENLDLDLLPRHIAIIMDGNGRWAAQRGLQRIAGHQEGLKALKEVLEICHELRIPYVTIYAFSQENWNRPKLEIQLLMNLLKQYLEEERALFHKRRVRFLPIGRLQQLPPAIHALVSEVAEETRQYQDRTLAVALSYGGRAEIIDAIRHIAVEVEMGSVSPERIDESLVESYLNTYGIPDPDLLIRTSGESRISNFLLWQIAYTELYFTKTLWPDFRRSETLQALLDYQRRERRFGRVGHTVSR
jgi:undecaprenyl diphosphate synthase